MDFPSRRYKFIKSLWARLGDSVNLEESTLTLKSEKQLKHILQKWGAKKKVDCSDMQDMISVKRRREEDGKTTDFMYHECPVDAAKLERAEKRRKTMIVPNPSQS